MTTGGAMPYALAGLLLAAAGTLAGWRAAVRPPRFARETYGMTARSHRRFAAASAIAAAVFAAALFWPALAVPALAAYVLALVLYGASFARGYSGEDEDL